MTAAPACVLCGSTAAPRPELSHPEGRLVRCPGCGLVHVDPLPAPEEARRLYGESYYRDPVRGYLDYEADEAAFRREFRRRLRLLIRVRPRGRLLEVGCATGGFLAEAARAGYEAEGIEPDAAVAATAAARSGRPVRAGTIEEVDLPAASFDVAVLFEVVEHLVDPVAALRRVARALRPGGLLAVSVPDYGSLWARLSGSRWPMITPWEHLHYFTRGTLAATLAAAGFDRVRFAPARTVFSVATAAFQLGIPVRFLPRRIARVGVGLPFGTLFAIAESVATPSPARV